MKRRPSRLNMLLVALGMAVVVVLAAACNSGSATTASPDHSAASGNGGSASISVGPSTPSATTGTGSSITIVTVMNAYAVAYKALVNAEGVPAPGAVKGDCALLFKATGHDQDQQPYEMNANPVLHRAGISLFNASIDLETWKCGKGGPANKLLRSPLQVVLADDILQGEAALQVVFSATGIDVSCTPNKQWAQVPSNLNAQSVAAILGVSVSAVSDGTYGPASCDKEVSENAIATTSPPIVDISGQAMRCAVIGTQDAPVAGADTKLVIAVCPGSGVYA